MHHGRLRTALGGVPCTPLASSLADLQDRADARVLEPRVQALALVQALEVLLGPARAQAVE
jgi:hypothetical protein